MGETIAGAGLLTTIVLAFSILKRIVMGETKLSRVWLVHPILSVSSSGS